VSFSSVADNARLFHVLRHNQVLSKLTMRGTGGAPLGCDGALLLAEALRTTRISYLDLRDNQIGDPGATALWKALAAQSATLPCNLCLDHNRITGLSAMDMLTQAAGFTDCRISLHFNLVDCRSMFLAAGRQLSDGCGTPLGHGAWAKSSASLDLSCNHLMGSGLALLCNHCGMTMRTLVELNLSGTGIDDYGVMMLVSCLTEGGTSPLTSLIADDCDVQEPGCDALARLLCSDFSLKTLSLCGNEFGNRGLSSLVKNGIGTLQLLGLGDNDLDDNMGPCLRDAILKSTSLKSLNLAHNWLGPRAVELLSEALTTPAAASKSCESLYLNSNLIDDRGAGALADMMLQNEGLLLLNLEGNAVGDDGVELILRSLVANPTMLYVACAFNPVSRSRLKSLEAWLKGNSSHVVELKRP